MKKLAVLAKMMVVLLFVCAMASPSWAGIKMEIDEQTKGEVGIWMQTWFQHVEDGKSGSNEDLNDFILRRAYMYLKGQVTEHVGFFTHIASDKIGQEGLDRPSLGLGSGVAWRDLWIALNLHESFKIQMGRMYVPLTRNYGTTSTKCMLTMDLPFLQGGSRGGIFYAQKVGRDDSVTIWGNPLDGLLQYRLMVSEGVEGETTSSSGTVVVSDNPDDDLRFVGRVSLSLLDPEKGWFNKGTYLGKKKVLSFGLGMDSQKDLTLKDVVDQDNFVWTVDGFFDYPVGEGAVTAEAAYIDIDNCTQNQPSAYTALSAGDDAKNWYINAGYLLPGSIGPGRLQPYVRYETVDVDTRNDSIDYETDFWSGGLNYYLKGHNAKLTADYMHIDQDKETATRVDRDIFTFQITLGF
ncbi:MAG: porin [Desulfobacterales bacterium]|nr:porin [Desulfobacterales bacterium]